MPIKAAGPYTYVHIDRYFVLSAFVLSVFHCKSEQVKIMTESAPIKLCEIIPDLSTLRKRWRRALLSISFVTKSQ